MCGFRGLDTTGGVSDLTTRLHEFLVEERMKETNKEPLTVFPVFDEPVAGYADWQRKNETKREELWNALTMQEKVRQNFAKSVHDALDLTDDQNIAFGINYRPKLPVDRNHQSYVDQPPMRRLFGFSRCMVYTTAPDKGTRYMRGQMIGTPWHISYDTWDGFAESTDEDTNQVYHPFPEEIGPETINGATWVGTGFCTGLIIGKSEKAVLEKIKEKCKRVEKDFIRTYVEQARNSVLGKSSEQGKPPTTVLIAC
jgi:hypothetical protein